MNRAAHAEQLRTDVEDAVIAYRLGLDAGFPGEDFAAAERRAVENVDGALRVLTDFAGLSDADAEREFDGAPDTQEAVTAPKGAER